MTTTDICQVAILTAALTASLVLIVDLWVAQWRAGEWQDAVTVLNWRRWSPFAVVGIPAGGLLMHCLAYHGF